MKKKIISMLLSLIILTAACLSLTACGNGDLNAETWNEAFNRAADELLDEKTITNKSTNFTLDIYSGDTHLTNVQKNKTDICITNYNSFGGNSLYYQVNDNSLDIYTPYERGAFNFYTRETSDIPEPEEADELIFINKNTSMVKNRPYKQLIGKFKWFKYNNGRYVLKEKNFSDFNAMYLKGHEKKEGISYNIKSLSFKIENGRIVEHSYDHKFTLDGQSGGYRVKYVYTYDNAPLITMPAVNSYEGVYVLNLLFSFSDEEIEFLNDNLSGDEETDKEVYDSLLENMVDKTDKRKIFGDGGIYEDIEQALLPLKGREAIDYFIDYFSRYSGDTNTDGYFVPLTGETPYITSFTELARKLYIDSDPGTSVGNAFVDDKLGYCVSEYGVHLLMVIEVIL